MKEEGLFYRAFQFYELYVQIEYSTNNIEMVDDDHVHDNKKIHGFGRG